MDCVLLWISLSLCVSLSLFVRSFIRCVCVYRGVAVKAKRSEEKKTHNKTAKRLRLSLCGETHSKTRFLIKNEINSERNYNNREQRALNRHSFRTNNTHTCTDAAATTTTTAVVTAANWVFLWVFHVLLLVRTAAVAVDDEKTPTTATSCDRNYFLICSRKRPHTIAYVGIRCLMNCEWARGSETEKCKCIGVGAAGAGAGSTTNTIPKSVRQRQRAQTVSLLWLFFSVFIMFVVVDFCCSSVQCRLLAIDVVYCRMRFLAFHVLFTHRHRLGRTNCFTMCTHIDSRSCPHTHTHTHSHGWRASVLAGPAATAAAAAKKKKQKETQRIAYIISY